MRYVNPFCHNTIPKLNQTKAWSPGGQARLHILVTKGGYSSRSRWEATKLLFEALWTDQCPWIHRGIHTAFQCTHVWQIAPCPATCNYFLPVPKTFMDKNKINIPLLLLLSWSVQDDNITKSPKGRTLGCLSACILPFPCPPTAGQILAEETIQRSSRWREWHSPGRIPMLPTFGRPPLSLERPVWGWSH